MNLPDQPDPDAPAASLAVRCLRAKLAIAWLRRGMGIDPTTTLARTLPFTRNTLAQVACGWADYMGIPLCEVWAPESPEAMECLVTDSRFLDWLNEATRFRPVIERFHDTIGTLQGSETAAETARDPLANHNLPRDTPRDMPQGDPEDFWSKDGETPPPWRDWPDEDGETRGWD